MIFPDVNYRRYVIKSIKVADGWQARAFRGRTIAGTVEKGATQADAIAAVRLQLDAANDVERAARGEDGYPTSRSV